MEQKSDYCQTDDDLRKTTREVWDRYYAEDDTSYVITTFLLFALFQAIASIGTVPQGIGHQIFGFVMTATIGGIWSAFTANCNSSFVRNFMWYWLGSDLLASILYYLGLAPVLQIIIICGILIFMFKKK